MEGPVPRIGVANNQHSTNHCQWHRDDGRGIQKPIDTNDFNATVVKWHTNGYRWHVSVHLFILWNSQSCLTRCFHRHMDIFSESWNWQKRTDWKSLTNCAIRLWNCNQQRCLLWLINLFRCAHRHRWYWSHYIHSTNTSTNIITKNCILRWIAISPIMTALVWSIDFQLYNGINRILCDFTMYINFLQTRIRTKKYVRHRTPFFFI